MPVTVKEVLERCSHAGAWSGTVIERLDQRNFLGDTPLHTVSSWADTVAVKALIAGGAAVNALGDQDNTPLFNAIMSEDEAVVTVLLRAGANPAPRNAWGKSAIEFARGFKLGGFKLEVQHQRRG